MQGGGDFEQASENLWLNSGLLSDCFSGDGLELAQLGTDIHSPIKPIERWLPPGHKSQLLQRHTATVRPFRGPFQEQASLCACKARKERGRGVDWQFAQMKLCTDNGIGSPKLFNVPNKLLFTIQSCRRAAYNSILWFSLWGYSWWY